MRLMLVVGTINRYAPPGPGWIVVHVDASARGIWDAEQGRNIPIDLQADMRRLPYPNSHADRIQCWHALEHVNEQGGRDAIREFARVLKPGGVLDVRVPDMAHAWAMPDLADALRVTYGDQTPMPDPELNVHRWGYDRWSLADLLHEHGFGAFEWPDPEYPDEIHLIACLS